MAQSQRPRGAGINGNDPQRELLNLIDSNFYDFCRTKLHVKGDKIEKFKENAEVDENAKFRQAQLAYNRNRPEFVRKHLPYLADFLRNIQPGTPYPDQMHGKYIYKIIDAQAKTGKSWRRYMRETFEVEIKEEDLVCTNKILSDEQKHSLLEDWLRQNQTVLENPVNELRRLLYEYKREKGL